MRTELRKTANDTAIDVIEDVTKKKRYSKSDLELRISQLQASIEKFQSEKNRLESLYEQITQSN